MPELSLFITQMKLMGYRINAEQTAIILPDGTQHTYLVYSGYSSFDGKRIEISSPALSKFSVAYGQVQLMYAHRFHVEKEDSLPPCELCKVILQDSWQIVHDGVLIGLDGGVVDWDSNVKKLTLLQNIPELGRAMVRSAILKYKEKHDSEEIYKI